MMATHDENVLDVRQEQYLEWLCTAPSERQPTSKEKYAASIGVDTKTLYRWQKREAFVRRWRVAVDEVVGSPDMTQSLIERLHREAMTGEGAAAVAAAKLYFQVTNQLQPPTQRIEVSRASDLSDAELSAMLAGAAASELAERSKG